MTIRRLFVAVTPSAAAIADLGAVVDGLHVSQANRPGHSTRLAARDRWHVTVVFLGDVPEERVDGAADAIQAGTAELAPFELRLAGGGTFGRGSRAILWSGLDGDVDRCASSARRSGGSCAGPGCRSTASRCGPT